MIARRLVTRTASTGLYYGFLAFVTLAALGPIIWVMVSSLKTNPQILSNGGFLPHPVTTAGYRNVFSEVHLQTALLNTLIYAAGGTIGALTAGFLAAYPTCEADLPGSSLHDGCIHRRARRADRGNDRS